MNQKKLKAFSIASALSFLALGIVYLIEFVSNINEHGSPFGWYNWDFDITYVNIRNFWYVVPIMGFITSICFSILIILNKGETGIVIILFMRLIYTFVSLVIYLIYTFDIVSFDLKHLWYAFIGERNDLLLIFSYAVMLLLVVLSFWRKIKIKEGAVYAIPGIMAAIICVITIEWSIYVFNYAYDRFIDFIFDVTIVSSLILFGLWLKIKNENIDDWSKTNFVESKVIKSTNFNKNIQTIDTAKSIEKIKSLKELLDCGAITQEEFNEKKKQLL